MKHASVGLKGDELKAIHPVVRTHPETGSIRFHTFLCTAYGWKKFTKKYLGMCILLYRKSAMAIKLTNTQNNRNKIICLN